MRLPKPTSCLLLTALCVAAQARAQAPAQPEKPMIAALALRIQLETSKLETNKLQAESIRQAIELELKRPVVIASAGSDAPQSLSVVAHANHTVTVSYRAANGLIRSRSIGTPQDPARCAEVIALLSGNLARDEAAELLANLAAKATAVPTSSATTAAPETAVPPEPEPNARPKAAALEHAEAASSPPPSPKRAAQSAPNPLLLTAPGLNLSLFAPLALYPDSERRLLNAELGLAFSHVGELHGAGLNVFALHTERDVHGASYATFYNRTGGTVYGAAASVIVNRSGSVRGAELSGLFNLSSGSVQGLSAAGIGNIERDFEGFQAAGLFNRAGRLQGLQVAGVVNIADELRGLQLGVVNVAGDVHGLQLGVVNVAKHVDGTSLGLVSVADNGRTQPLVWASTLLPLNVAMKFTVGYFYTQVGIGYAPSNHTYTYELGLGAHLQAGHFFVEPGVHYSEMRDAKQIFDHELLEHAHYRLCVGLDLGRISPFVGFAVLQRFAHSVDAPASQPVSAEAFAGAALF